MHPVYTKLAVRQNVCWIYQTGTKAQIRYFLSIRFITFIFSSVMYIHISTDEYNIQNLDVIFADFSAQTPNFGGCKYAAKLVFPSWRNIQLHSNEWDFNSL
ncbi:hypothetical protein FKM82_000040 [Ascaphus truei]